MNLDIHESWIPFLLEEFDKPYFKALETFVKKEYEQHTCYPPSEDIFNAFAYCHFNHTKVVIIGQDPYHGHGQAHGLCFSVNDGVPHPPSLSNIFKEIEQDIGTPHPKSGNLSRWADQGVLLLNATLTVRANRAGSHQKRGWETFTDAVIKMISTELKGVVFLLWGTYGKNKIRLVDSEKHHILTSGHPSPLSANRGYWFGNRHFSSANSLLEQQQSKPIIW